MGDPNSDWSEELWPHGRRINIGAYGGTAQASMSLLEIGDFRDLNNDDIVNWDDVLILGEKGDSNDVPLKEDLDLDGIVDVNDLMLFEGNWEEGSLNNMPILDVVEDKYVDVGTRLLFIISALDIDGDQLVYEALGMPEDALFYEQLFSWTPENPGIYPITFMVNDYESLDFLTVQIIVE